MCVSFQKWLNVLKKQLFLVTYGLRLTNDYSILRNVSVATIIVSLESPPRMAEFVNKTVISGNLRFKVVFNSYFYDFPVLRNVAVAIIKMGVVSPPRMAEFVK